MPFNDSREFTTDWNGNWKALTMRNVSGARSISCTSGRHPLVKSFDTKHEE
jgi:hypothetical protein